MNNLLSFFWILALFTPMLQADKGSPYQLKMRQASGFYDISAYPQANILYQELLAEPLTSWQKAVLIYNMGTVHIAEGKWDQAITDFKGVPFEEVPSPLLLFRTKTNLALAYWQKAHALLPDAQTETYDQIIELLKASLKEIEGAKEAHCSLEKIEGSPNCIPVHDLQKMHRAILGQMALTLLQKKEENFSHPSLEKGLPFLLEGINDVRSHLDFMQKHSLQGNLKQHYVDLFVQSAQSWLPLWSAMIPKIQESKQQNLMTLYLKGEKRYKEGIHRLEQQEWEASSAAFDTAAAAIQTLIKQLEPKDTSSHGKTRPETSASSKESKPNAETSIPEKGGSAMDQVLRLLIEMQKEDASLAPAPSTANKKELRPW